MLALKKLEERRTARARDSDNKNDITPSPSGAHARPIIKSPSTSTHSPNKRPKDKAVFPWEFSSDDLERFPALRKRNFYCIQRHQARALHYDLRLQVDGGTFSWALPRGLIGMDKKAEASHMAVQTTIHPISYSVHEGTDGVVLWDIGEYAIDDASDDEDERKSKRRRLTEAEDEDPYVKRRDRDLGVLRLITQSGSTRGGQIERSSTAQDTQWQATYYPLNSKAWKKAFIFILDVHNPKSLQYDRNGNGKKTWFVRLPKSVAAIPWDRGGEEGDFWGRSVKTETSAGRTFAEVCSSTPSHPVMFDSEIAEYEGWSEAKGDGNWEEDLNPSVKVVQAAK